MAGEPDGTLFDWSDIVTSHEWDTLLLGNGMSINIWEPFAYRKLYDRAKFGDLSAQDRKLFSSTPNFERVLADLLTAIRVNDAIGLDAKPLLERYRNIQLALVQAVREVHLKLSRVPLATRKIINDTMEQFEWVFTTSYDLLVYWAMAAGGFEPFMDHFRYRGRCEFDPARASVPANRIPVYFLHGALHLVAGGGSGARLELRRRPLTRLRNLARVDDLAGAIQDPDLASAFLTDQLLRGLDGVGLRRAVRGRTPMALPDNVPASSAGGLFHVARIFHPDLLMAIFSS